MRAYLRCMIVLLLMVAMPVSLSLAEEKSLTVDLAEDSVDITLGFDGANLVLFGHKEKAGQVAVIVRGPKKDVTVRKKGTTGGIWMNKDSVTFEEVPQFYDFALSHAEENILDDLGRKNSGIGLDSLKTLPKEKLSGEALKGFQNALIRNKQAELLFPQEPKNIIFLSDNFFRTEFYVPSNVPKGEYQIETFLIGGKNIIDRHVTKVQVAQVGFNSNVYRFAHSYPLAYAMVIVFIAVVAGWLSNAVRRNNN